MDPLIEFAVSRGAPCLLIDHVTKAATEASGYARGSGDKLAAVQAQWYVRKARDFSETEIGEIELVRWKARSGGLNSRHRFEVGDGQSALTFLPLDALASPEGKLDAAIIRFFKAGDPADYSMREIEGGVEGTAAKVRDRVKELARTDAQPVKAIEGAGSHPRYAFDPTVAYEPPPLEF